MPEQLVGAEVRAGQFTDKTTGRLVSYNNLVLQLGLPAAGGGVMCKAEPVKVKNTVADITRFFGEQISMSWLKAHLGWWCDVFYDDYKRPVRIEFHGTEDPRKQAEAPTPTVEAPLEGITDYEPLVRQTPQGNGLAPDPMDDFPAEFVEDSKKKDGKK